MKNIDLSKIDRRAKLEILDALEEKRKRQLENRPTYTPNDGQKQVHKSEATLRLVSAANGSGKSALAVQEALWAAEGYNPVLDKKTIVPAKVVVVLDSPAKVDEVWLPEIRKWRHLKMEQLHKRGKPYYSQIVFDNGSDIVFMFNEQEELAFESIQLDFCVADEPMKRANYIGLRRAGRKKGRKAKYLLIATPITGAWMRKEIWEPWSKGELPDTDCFRFSTEVNKENLLEGYIETFSRVLSEKEKRIRLHGEFFDLDGLALAHLFDRKTHVVDPFSFNNWPCVVAIDPHPSKNHIAVLLGADNNNKLYVIRELSSPSAPKKFAQELKEFYKGFRIVDIVSDSLGATPGTGGDGNKSLIEVLKEQGIRVRSTTYKDKDDEDFIQRIQQVLEIPEAADNFGQRLPKLRIFSNCRGSINDVESVEWLKYKNLDEFKPKLNISNKDFLACIKYALATNLVFLKKKPKMAATAVRSPWSYNR